jgi:glycosyltransferase involved in cell wall biosynthesis
VPIALVITDLDVGGAERALVSLATRLDRGRWRVSVVGLAADGRLAEDLRIAGLEAHCLGATPRRPLRGVLRLANALRRLRPALVQSFLFHANIASRLAARALGRPWVLGGIRVAERRMGWHRWVDRLTQRLACGSVCVSEGVRRFSVEVAGLDPDRLAVIPNGVDTDAIDRAPAVPRESLGIDADAPLALFVGRFDRQKGLDVLLDAAGRVADARPDWRLCLVGEGPECAAIAGRLGADPRLAERVRLLGRRDDVAGLLKAADVLVLPSLWEGMPNVILEAMAARRAVVATAVEGSAELVVPGETGWLVPPGDADALAEALRAAARDRTAAVRFGQAGRERVELRYRPGDVVAAYESLWARLLGLDLDTAPGLRRTDGAGNASVDPQDAARVGPMMESG